MHTKSNTSIERHLTDSYWVYTSKQKRTIQPLINYRLTGNEYEIPF